MSKVIILYANTPEASRKEAVKASKADKKAKEKAKFKALRKRKKYCDAKGLNTKDLPLQDFM